VNALQAQDEEIGMALKELAIEQYDKFNKMNRPEVRLGMVFVMTLIQVDSTNRMRAALGAAVRPVLCVSALTLGTMTFGVESVQ
jgi:hypothetical protein